MNATAQAIKEDRPVWLMLPLLALALWWLALCGGCAFIKGIDSGTRTYGLPNRTNGTNGTDDLKAILPPLSTNDPQPTTVTLAADFAPTGLGNLTAFFEVTGDLATTNWTRLEQPYPFAGGTLTQTYTNNGDFFWRAGYTIN